MATQLVVVQTEQDHEDPLEEEGVGVLCQGIKVLPKLNDFFIEGSSIPPRALRTECLKEIGNTSHRNLIKGLYI